MKPFAFLLAAGLVLGALPQIYAADAPAAEQSDVKTVRLKVTGMTCGGCSSSINKKVGALKGVVSCKADHEAGVADVTFHAGAVSESDIAREITKLGFGATAEPTP